MKIAYICDKEHYLKKMSRVRFHSMEAIERMSTFYWGGPNWENWDNNKTVDGNLEANNFTPDLIVGYKPLETKGFADSKFTKCLRYNEMYDDEWTLSEINKSAVDIVVCHHKNDWEEWKDRKLHKPVDFINIPHCADRSVFKDYKLPKAHDVLLVGAINVATKLGQHYPLRQKMLDVLAEMSDDYKVGVFQHPGYILGDAHKNAYAVDFAKAINSSRICVTCSGMPKSRFGKYVEIPACRTAIAADIPDEEQETFKKFIIEINVNDSNITIINKLKKYLDDEEELKKTTDRGWLLMKKYTQDWYASVFIEKISKILSKR
ncbi:hypothetical protein CMI37_25400 [Candidatus Pacearchaeota archaeon]|nr:hypothetical protein [Candidatus Pacearchaeota archaeon]